jgi:hypothetical protein
MVRIAGKGRHGRTLREIDYRIFCRAREIKFSKLRRSVETGAPASLHQGAAKAQGLRLLTLGPIHRHRKASCREHFRASRNFWAGAING